MLLFSFFKKYEPLIPVQSLFPSFVLFTSGGFRRPKPVGYLLNHNNEQNQTKNAPTIEIKKPKLKSVQSLKKKRTTTCRVMSNDNACALEE